MTDHQGVPIGQRPNDDEYHPMKFSGIDDSGREFSLTMEDKCPRCGYWKHRGNIVCRPCIKENPKAGEFYMKNPL